MPLHDPASQHALVDLNASADSQHSYAPPADGHWGDMPERAEAGINIVSLLHSLRRSWARALGLGVLTSGIAAALLWIFLPIKYTAEAMIKVERPNPSLDGNQRFESDQAYEQFRETQAGYITSTWIISTAMRNHPAIQNFSILRRERNKAAWISDHIKVRPMGDSELLVLELRAENDREVTTLLEEVIKAYDERVLQESRKEKLDQLAKLKDAVRGKTEALDKMTDEYITLCENLKVPPSPSLHRSAFEHLMKRSSDKSAELTDIRRELAEIDKRISEASTRLDSNMVRVDENLVLEEMSRHPEYLELKKVKLEVEDERDRAARTYPDSDMVRSANREIARIDDKMKMKRKELEPLIRSRLANELGLSPQEIQNTLTVAERRKASLEKNVAKLEEELADIGENVQQINAANADLLARDEAIQQERKVLGELRNKYAYLDLELKDPSRISVVQMPEIREESSFVMKLLEVFSAGLFVFGLTAVGVALWDYQAKRVNSSAELASALDVRLLGTLPLIHSGSLVSFGGRSPEMLELTLTRSADSLRAAVVFNRQGGQIKVLMITSAVDQEGRTTLASQLAISMARSGRRTLLIDADVMNPQQHEVFQVPGNSGLCDVINGSKTPADDVIRPTNVENLWLMPAGPFVGDVQFVGEEAKRLFDELRTKFDMVILETGPVLTGPEALLLGQYVDSTILSVRRDESRMPRVEAAIERLRAVGITILGAALHDDGTAMRRSVTPTVAVGNSARQIEKAKSSVIPANSGGAPELELPPLPDVNDSAP